MNGGVYEPLAVPIVRSFLITTVRFVVADGFVTRLWLSEVARCTQRGLFEATAGERERERERERESDEPAYNMA
jgi:hypothetical protein